jgi:flavin reductase (DIM6/NTAB) family NADH-FMN oxidoreductase RutF
VRAVQLAELEARGFEVVERYGCPTLKDCLGVVHLRIEHLQDIGDHDLALCGAPSTTYVLRAIVLASRGNV